MAATPPHRRGFTLIELLVVIGIIGVLVSLLVPTVSMAMVMVRKHVTRSIIKELEVGIEAFKVDFKAYPPSEPYVPGRETTGRRLTGAANLAYYLLGPDRSGWGLAGGRLMPFGGSSPGRSYGPYFQADEEALAYDNSGRIAGFLDAFSPAGIILYFAARPDSTTGELTFEWQDGGTTTNGGRTNYASQDYFRQCTMQVHGRGSSAPRTFWRNDYFLVSPGLDGRYGAIIRNESTGEWVPTDLNTAMSQCDDIGNWKRTRER